MRTIKNRLSALLLGGLFCVVGSGQATAVDTCGDTYIVVSETPCYFWNGDGPYTSFSVAGSPYNCGDYAYYRERYCVPVSPGDDDGDGTPNENDPAPYDPSIGGSDSDGDGVPDSQDHGPSGADEETGTCPDGSVVAAADYPNQCDDGSCPVNYVRQTDGSCLATCGGEKRSGFYEEAFAGGTVPDSKCVPSKYADTLGGYCTVVRESSPVTSGYFQTPAGDWDYMRGYMYEESGSTCGTDSTSSTGVVVVDPKGNCSQYEVKDHNGNCVFQPPDCGFANSYFSIGANSCRCVMGYTMNAGGTCDRNVETVIEEPDRDGDGIPDSRDAYPDDAANGQADADSDGIPDAEDEFPNDPSNALSLLDSDSDGTPDGQDPAPFNSAVGGASGSFTTMVDTDGDGVGDTEEVADAPCGSLEDCLGSGDGTGLSSDPYALYTPQFEGVEQVYEKWNGRLRDTPAGEWVSWLQQHSAVVNACPALPPLDLGRWGVFPMEVPCIVYDTFMIIINLMTAWTAALMLIDRR